MPRFSPAAAILQHGARTCDSILRKAQDRPLQNNCENMRKPDEMEPSQIKQQIADLTERANALRGYL